MRKPEISIGPAFINPHKKRYDGHFRYEFTENAQGFSLGSISVKKSEALVRLGVMPHNNILINKVINSFGDRVLELLRNAPAIERERVKDSFIYQAIADETELLSSWVMLEILSAIKPLEQLTRYQPSDIIRNNTDILSNTKKILSELEKKLKNYFQDNVQKDMPFTAVLDRKLNILIHNAGEKLEKYDADKTSDQYHQTFQRDLLRHLINDFEQLQASISIEQRSALNLFSISNGTNTSATQKAYYAIQNHVYSAKGCTESQLWMEPRSVETNVPAHATADSPSTKREQLDTAKYPGIHQEDALFAACLIEASATSSVSIETVADAQKNYRQGKEKVKDQHTALKKAIDKERGSRLGLFRDADVAHALRKSDPFALVTQKDSWSWFYLNSEAVAKLIREKEKEDQLVEEVFASTSAAYVYKPADLFSAISITAYEFSEYFSREMAAKHPGIATVGFAIPSAYMASVALASIGIAPHLMQMIYTSLSKVLSVNGHLVDPNAITEVFRQVSNSWLWLTKAHGMTETLIMTAFGGPKISYLVTEQINKMLSGVDQTTVSAMVKLFSSGDLDTQLPIDQLREKAKTLLQTMMMLGLAVGLGLGSAALPHTVPGAELIKSMVGILDNVDSSTFTNLATAHGVLNKAAAVAQLLATVKTAGLFIGKLLGVAHFLRKGHEQEDLAAIRYFQSIQTSKTQDPNFPIPTTSPEFQKAKKILEANIAENPQTKSLFAAVVGDDKMAFLNACGVQEILPPPPFVSTMRNLFIKTPEVVAGFVLTAVVGAIGAVTVFPLCQLYSAITGQEAVPDNKTLRYIYKNSAKFMLGMVKLMTLIWHPIKFFVQAVSGFIARLGSGLWAILKTGDEIRRRAFAENGNALGYLGNQLFKTVGLFFLYMSKIVKAVEFIAKAVAIILEVACTPLFLLIAVSYAIKKVGSESFFANFKKAVTTCYIAPLEAISFVTSPAFSILSNLTQKLQDKAVIFERNDSFSKLIQSSHWFIHVKNWCGDGLSAMRDVMMRKLEHTLQVVAQKDQEQSLPANQEPHSELRKGQGYTRGVGLFADRTKGNTGRPRQNSSSQVARQSL